MTSKAEKEKLKLVQEKCQVILADLLRDEDNKYCVDCDAKGPRWASWNLGIFLCIRCAGIHRNLGVHISRVKSINLDAWNASQVAHLQHMGNSKARAVYEANLPDNFKRPQTDSALEAFVRAKYEHKKYIAREWKQPEAPQPAFDIEEEVKKEKERKKNKSKQVQNSSPKLDVESNPLPRPHSSPAGTVINVDKISKDVRKSPTNNINSDKNSYSDLLGLDVGSPCSDQSNSKSSDDDFGGFVSSTTTMNVTHSNSAPQTSQNTTENKKVLTPDEEADFFNQKAPDNASKVLSKESILSLYANLGGTGSSIPQAQAQQQQQNILGASSVGFQQQQAFNAYNMPQQQVQAGAGFFMPPSSGMTGAGTALPQSAQLQLGQQSVFPVTTNPFLSNSSSSNVGQQPTVTVTQAQLPQQMSSLQLGQLAGMPSTLNAPVISNTNWMTMNAAPNMNNPVVNQGSAVINPFMTSPSPMAQTGIAGIDSNFGNVGLNSGGMFAESDMNMTNQWMAMTSNPSMGQQASLPATTNLWQ